MEPPGATGIHDTNKVWKIKLSFRYPNFDVMSHNSYPVIFFGVLWNNKLKIADDDARVDLQR